MMRQAITVKIEGKEGDVKIVDWTDRIDDPRYQLADVGKVVTGPAELRGRTIRYVGIPDKLPSQEEIDRFLREVKEKGFEGLRIARKVALLSLTPYKIGR